MSKLSESKPFYPIVLQMIHVQLELLFDSGIIPFSLSVSLWMGMWLMGFLVSAIEYNASINDKTNCGP